MPAPKDYLNSKHGQKAIKMLEQVEAFCKKYHHFPIIHTNPENLMEEYENKLHIFVGNFMANNSTKTDVTVSNIYNRLKTLSEIYPNGVNLRYLKSQEVVKEMEEFCYQFGRYPKSYRTPKTKAEIAEDNLNHRLDFYAGENSDSFNQSPMKGQDDVRLAAAKRIQLFKDVYGYSMALDIDEIKCVIEIIQFFTKTRGHYPSSIKQTNSQADIKNFQNELYVKASSIINNPYINPLLRNELKEFRANSTKSISYYTSIRRRKDLTPEQIDSLVLESRENDELLARQLIEKLQSYKVLKGVRSCCAYFNEFPRATSEQKVERDASAKVMTLLHSNLTNPYLDNVRNEINQLSAQFTLKK